MKYIKAIFPSKKNQAANPVASLAITSIYQNQCNGY